MSENESFSLEASEALIDSLTKGTPSEFADLHPQLVTALTLLAHTPALPIGSLPPALPSGAIPIKSKKSHRTAFTAILATVVLASASLTAAAVTGKGPEPVIAAAHSTANFMREIAGAVTNVVTNKKTLPVQIPSSKATPSTPANSGGSEDKGGALLNVDILGTISADDEDGENSQPSPTPTRNRVSPKGVSTSNSPTGNLRENLLGSDLSSLLPLLGVQSDEDTNSQPSD